MAKLSSPALKPVTAGFWCLTITSDEISLVCEEALCPSDARCVESGWGCLRLEGPIDFSFTGVLLSVLRPLFEIPIFAVSTFDTDYVLVKAMDLQVSIEALEGAGHVVQYATISSSG